MRLPARPEIYLQTERMCNILDPSISAHGPQRIPTLDESRSEGGAACAQGLPPIRAPAGKQTSPPKLSHYAVRRRPVAVSRTAP